MIVDFFVAQSEWAVMFAVYIQSMLNISIANVGYLVFFIVFAVNSKLRRKLWRFLVGAILVQCGVSRSLEYTSANAQRPGFAVREKIFSLRHGCCWSGYLRCGRVPCACFWMSGVK